MHYMPLHASHDANDALTPIASDIRACVRLRTSSSRTCTQSARAAESQLAAGLASLAGSESESA